MEEVLTAVPMVPTLPGAPTVPAVTSVTVIPSVPIVPSVQSMSVVHSMLSVPSAPTVPVVPMPPPSSDILLNEMKIQTNPWTVNDLDVFLFYCCPQCDHKTRSKSHFLDHAFLSHPEAQETIRSMHNRQVFHIHDKDKCLNENERTGMKSYHFILDREVKAL